MEVIQRAAPDLAIVDISLKDSSGLALIKGLKALSMQLPILVFSMHDESLYAQRVLRAGASGYITKDRPPTEVLTAIRHVLGGEVYLSQKMTSQFLKSVRTSGGPASALGPVDRLTDRELAVLEKIGQGYSTRKIAAELQVGVATVDTYRARIKEKLNFQNGSELLHFAIQWIRQHE
jgi:DNA-binding NarL/FixJ family response regulator